MATLFLKSTDIKIIYDQLGQYFGENSIVKDNEHILNFNNKLGNGHIFGRFFKDGITYMEFDMILFVYPQTLITTY